VLTSPLVDLDPETGMPRASGVPVVLGRVEEDSP
jgi:hypothetical protein